MATRWDGMRRTNLHGDFYEMEIISNQYFSVGVHVDSDPEFRAYILAAGTAHARGNQSIDNILRRHKREWMRRFEKEEAERSGGLSELRQKLSYAVSQRCRAISALDLSTISTYGVIAAANAQIRLDSTFHGALLLIQGGHPCESEAVIRLGLEQVAWTYGIRNLKTAEQVEHTSGTGWINKLKPVFPGVGHFYGRLSNLAHMAPATHHRFLGVSEGKTHVKIRAPDTALESFLYLITLLDAFLVISERCFHTAGLDCENIDPASGTILERRTASELICAYLGALPPGTVEFFRSWWR
jgi:hypothetical protein